MRKHFLVLVLIMAVSITVHSQSRGVKIGYIDMEYILQNVPDYMEAKNQLEQKAQKWKQEIETKKVEVNKLKESLKTERVLLTKELILEREDEITFQEKELLDYQQKRFGPNGDLIIQKAVLTQPVQDQVFTAAQDIAEAKKYDFIFDKTSDLTMLFAAKRYDISDQVIRVITRATKRSQLSKKQLKEEAAKDAKEDMVDETPALAARQKILDDKKAAREKLIADKKLAAEEKKKAADDQRKQLQAEKEAKKSGTTVPVNQTEKTNVVPQVQARKAVDSTAIIAKQKASEERARVIEERKKSAEEKKQRILSDREAQKSENVVPLKKEENKNSEKPVVKTEESASKKATDSIAADAKQKALQSRAKTIEDRKRALEDKKKKILEEREAAKKAKEENPK
jgi:Skp family chaperone for outer membrane proteins